MKMAAAEAVFETESGVPFSMFTIGTLDGTENVLTIGVPGLAVVPGHRTTSTARSRASTTSRRSTSSSSASPRG